MSGPDPPPDPVADAWEASSLSLATAPSFYRRVERDRAEPDPIGPLATSDPQVPLPEVDDRLQRCFARRRSTKTFDGEPLPAASVARILAAVGPAGREHFYSGRLRRPAGAPGPPRRVVPSPGGLETVNAYAIGSLVEGPISGRVARYDHRRHEVALLGPTPPPAELRSLFSLDSDGDPQLLLVWVTDPRAALARYGARALRLVLQEVGHAAQNVALRLAADGLAGYPLGGVLDREVLALLGLRQFDLWVAGGFACGRSRL